MDEMINRERGTCSLLIYGDYIDFQLIEHNLKIKPTRTVKKGEPVLKSGALGNCQTNGWFYSVKFSNTEELTNALNILLSIIYPYKDNLKRLMDEVIDTDIYVKIAIQSDYAQMSFFIEPEQQKLLADMGLKLICSIFSFGLVENNNDELIEEV